eukprot:m.274682 g.274682  ORF g.274682 m.274682 type:complete len:299 (+) comp40587_c0_seq25:881-1777(+)
MLLQILRWRSLVLMVAFLLANNSFTLKGSHIMVQNCKIPVLSIIPTLHSFRGMLQPKFYPGHQTLVLILVSKVKMPLFSALILVSLDLGSGDIAYTLEALFADTGAASIQHHSEEAGMVYPAQTEDQAPDMIAAPEMLTKGVDGKLRHNARAMQAHEISSASAGVSKQADTDQAHEISDASADVSDQADADLDSDKVRLGFATVFRNSRRQKSVKTFQLRAYVVPEQILKKNMMTALIKDTAVLTVVNYRESHSRWVEAKGTFSSGKDTHKKTFGRNEAYAYSFEEQLPFVASWNTSP